MAGIDVGTLTDRLSAEEVEELLSSLRVHLGESDYELPAGDESASRTILGGIDPSVLDEFLDRLESNDMGCDLYVPVEFEGRIEAGELTVGSLPALMDVLEEMQDDLEIETPEDGEDELNEEDDDEGEGDLEILKTALRNVWHALYEGGVVAGEARLALLVIR